MMSQQTLSVGAQPIHERCAEILEGCLRQIHHLSGIHSKGGRHMLHSRRDQSA